LTAGPAAAAELTTAAANVAALGITDLRLRYVGDSTVGVPADAADAGRAWVADVAVRWRLAGLDASASTLVVPVVLAEVGQDVVLRTARFTSGRRVPLWLLTPLAVRRTDAGLVATADPGRLAALTDLQQRAVAAVRAAVPGWTGQLVLEAPATSEQFAASVGDADDREVVTGFAGVTTTADGRRSTDSAMRVALHPELFWTLGPRGRQVVTTHEATHVALGSVLRPVPTWLSEGIADHVALRGSGIPVRDSAAGAIAMVRREGLPDGLPTDEQLVESGAWYEAAWLAVRTLAERYGEVALLDFYRAAARDGATDRALEEVLGTTEAELVSAWRGELAALAGVARPAAAGVAGWSP
jgi:hypothetical protein